MADNFETDKCRQTDAARQVGSPCSIHRNRGRQTTLRLTSVDKKRQTGSHSNTLRYRGWHTTLKQTSVDRQRKDS